MPFAGHLEAGVDAAFEMRLKEPLQNCVTIGLQLPLIVHAFRVDGGKGTVEFRLGPWPDNSRFGGDWANRASGFGGIARTIRITATTPANVRPQRPINVQAKSPLAAMVEVGGSAFLAGEFGSEEFTGSIDDRRIWCIIGIVESNPAPDTLTTFKRRGRGAAAITFSHVQVTYTKTCSPSQLPPTISQRSKTPLVAAATI